MFRAAGSMFEQEHLRLISMFAATGGGGSGGGGHRFVKGIMGHTVIQYLKAVNGDKSLFRKWHHKFTTGLGQVAGAHEEIVHRLVKEIDLGGDIEKIVIGLR